MRSAALAAVLLFATTAAAELPTGEQLIHTKDGRALRGIILSETQTGYLIDTGDHTELVLFSNIQDILPTGGELPAPPPPPAFELPPPPQAEPPPQPDWRADRKGFHWALGAGGMVDPGFTGGGGGGTTTVAGFVAAMGAVRWGFGWLDVQAELMPLGYFRGATKALFLGFNPQLRINFARFYSLGVGIYGAAVIVPAVDFVLGPSFSPAIFRIGASGEHELRLWIASPILATSSWLSNGVTLLLASYSYVL